MVYSFNTSYITINRNSIFGHFFQGRVSIHPILLLITNSHFIYLFMCVSIHPILLLIGYTLLEEYIKTSFNTSYITINQVIQGGGGRPTPFQYILYYY